MTGRTPLSKKPSNNQNNFKSGLKRKADYEAIDDVVVAQDAAAAKRVKTQVATPSKSHREDELVEWRRKQRKAFKSYIFYLDLDTKQSLDLTEAVTNLGSVCFDAAHIYLLTFCPSDCREVLLEQSHTCSNMEAWSRREKG